MVLVSYNNILIRRKPQKKLFVLLLFASERVLICVTCCPFFWLSNFNLGKKKLWDKTTKVALVCAIIWPRHWVNVQLLQNHLTEQLKGKNDFVTV